MMAPSALRDTLRRLCHPCLDPPALHRSAVDRQVSNPVEMSSRRSLPSSPPCISTRPAPPFSDGFLNPEDLPFGPEVRKTSQLPLRIGHGS